MNIRATIGVTAALLMGVQAMAQEPTKDEIQLFQTMWGMEKREAIVQAMDLDDKDGAAFWPIYDSYEEARRKIGSERILIISDYINKYESLTDADADALAQRVFKNDAQFDKLQKTYYEKMKKAVGALKAAKFIQIETFILTSIRSSIQSELPFIGEIPVKTKP